MSGRRRSTGQLTGGVADVDVGEALGHRTLVCGVLDGDIEDSQEVSDAAVAMVVLGFEAHECAVVEQGSECRATVE